MLLARSNHVKSIFEFHLLLHHAVHTSWHTKLDTEQQQFGVVAVASQGGCATWAKCPLLIKTFAINV